MTNILREVKEFAEKNGLAQRTLYNKETDQYCMVGALGQALGLDVEDATYNHTDHVIHDKVNESRAGQILAETISANYPKYNINIPGMTADCVIFRFNDQNPIEERIQMLDKAAVQFDSLVE